MYCHHHIFLFAFLYSQWNPLCFTIVWTYFDSVSIYSWSALSFCVNRSLPFRGTNHFSNICPDIPSQHPNSRDLLHQCMISFFIIFSCTFVCATIATTLPKSYEDADHYFVYVDLSLKPLLVPILLLLIILKIVVSEGMRGIGSCFLLSWSTLRDVVYLLEQ